MYHCRLLLTSEQSRELGFRRSNQICRRLTKDWERRKEHLSWISEELMYKQTECERWWWSACHISAQLPVPGFSSTTDWDPSQLQVHLLLMNSIKVLLQYTTCMYFSRFWGQVETTSVFNHVFSEGWFMIHSGTIGKNWNYILFFRIPLYSCV